MSEISIWKSGRLVKIIKFIIQRLEEGMDRFHSFLLLIHISWRETFLNSFMNISDISKDLYIIKSIKETVISLDFSLYEN